MIRFVLCGHGSYGSSLKESLEMLLPEVEGVDIIDFTKEMGLSELEEKVREKLQELGDTPTLFVTDILGGAPFKICAIESLNHQNKIVIAGINLTALLEVSFMRDQDLEALAKRAVEVSKETIDYMPKN